MLSAIIVAGGSSQRMGFDKTFASIGDKPVIAHSIAAFEAADLVSEIIVVGRAAKLSALEEIVVVGRFRKVKRIIAGGARRQDSVVCGLNALDGTAEFVAVHDAARPLVRPELIERVYQLARERGGAAAAAPVTDTLKRADELHRVTGGVERAGLFGVQTPQIFRRDLLEEAYRAVAAAGAEITDDISAVELVQGEVILLPNDQPNFKITYPADLPMAEFLLTHLSNQR
jgi:2-C-methyl-D-erythritol 4-phosphate cytidylyltransferase